MTEEKKDPLKLKTSEMFLIIGICLFVIGLIITIVSIVNYKQSYDAWHDAWWYYHSADLNDSPSPFPIVIGVIITFGSTPLIVIGLTPHITKVASKIKSETLDYAGESITEAGVKTIDVVKPIINKEVDEIVVPSIGKVVGSVKNNITDNQTYCPQCGDKIDNDEEFCSKCGLKLKNKCSICGYINEAENNFCKKCGTKIK